MATVPSPITALLSQYEPLALVCENLSSADIIHLGATSKEHWQYVASSPVILSGLIAQSSCNGKGITAQARVFGHWKADPTETKVKCRGKDAKPCSNCGAMVCNICRFHLVHSDFHSGYAPVPESSEEEAEADSDWDLTEVAIGCNVRDGLLDVEDVTTEVEMLKTIGMLNTKTQTHCEDCQPLILETPDWRGWCKCNLHSHFVAPWRCIPCVLSEEAQLIASQQEYTVTYDPGEPERRWMYEKESFCRCGKRAIEQGHEMCGWCGKADCYDTSRTAFTLKLIHAQLGTSDSREDPILSQLG